MEIVNDLSGSFCVIPIALLSDGRLSDSARLLYCRIASGDASLDFGDSSLVAQLGELRSAGWLLFSVDDSTGSVSSCRLFSACHQFCVSQAHTCDNKYADLEDNKIGNIIPTDTDTDTVTRVSDSVLKIGWIDLKETEEEEKKKYTKKERTTRKESGDFDFDQCWVAYRRKGSKKKSLEQWKRLTVDERKMVLPHVKAYVSCRELVYQRDFERYLRDKTFKDIVLDGTVVVYDPSKADVNVGKYCPTIGGQLRWNAIRNCYVFTGVDESYIFDGYTDETRPDGSEVLMNNGRGVVRWSVQSRSWVKVQN